MARKATPAATGETPAGERIAKVLSRRGIASRREAERLIALGEVAVNGRVIDSPALNVTAKDRITVSGQPLPDKEPVRLWLYYKPEGLVTSASDEKGRDTVFDHLPEDLPRVMSVGRLDLNSEGLLLLTNDGELKRRLELPSTGWLRKYRVRVNGTPTDAMLEPLRKGITVDGERFQPMTVTLDRVQGANAWLTVGLREGRNREIRRAMNAIELYVNRLIRVSYGPFRLNEMEPGEVVEVKGRVLRDQLGEGPTPEDEAPPAPTRRRAPRPGRDIADPGIRSLAQAWDKRTAGPAAKPAPRREADAPTSTRKPAPRRDDDTPTRRPAAKPHTRRDDDTSSRKPSPRRDADAPASTRKPAPRRDDDTAPRRPAAKPAPRRDDDTPSRRAPAEPGPRRDAEGTPRKPAAEPSTRRDDDARKPAPRRDADAPSGRRAPSATGKTATTGKPAAKPLAARKDGAPVVPRKPAAKPAPRPKGGTSDRPAPKGPPRRKG